MRRSNELGNSSYDNDKSLSARVVIHGGFVISRYLNRPGSETEGEGYTSKRYRQLMRASVALAVPTESLPKENPAIASSEIRQKTPVLLGMGFWPGV